MKGGKHLLFSKVKHIVDTLNAEDSLLIVNEENEILLSAKVGDDIVKQRMAILGKATVYEYERADLKDRYSHMLVVGNN